MGSLVINGDTSGAITLQAPAIAGTTTLTLPTTNGTLVLADSSGNVGIGTNSPSNKLDISGGNVRVSNSGTDIYYALENTASGGRNWTITATATGSGEGAGFFLIKDTTTPASRLRIDSSGNLQFNSGYGSAATAYGCRAWAKFDGTAVTPSPSASGNISSITDGGTGVYTMNFTTAMPDANYSMHVVIGQQATSTRILSTNCPSTAAPTTSAFQFRTYQGSASDGGGGYTLTDMAHISVAVFR